MQLRPYVEDVGPRGQRNVQRRKAAGVVSACSLSLWEPVREGIVELHQEGHGLFDGLLDNVGVCEGACDDVRHDRNKAPNLCCMCPQLSPPGQVEHAHREVVDADPGLCASIRTFEPVFQTLQALLRFVPGLLVQHKD